MCVHMCCGPCEQVRGQCAEVSIMLYQYRSSESNSDCRSWQQAPLLAQSSCWICVIPPNSCDASETYEDKGTTKI